MPLFAPGMGAPWVFGFADERAVTTNIAGTGALVMLLAIWAMLQDVDIERLRDPGTR